MKISIIGYSGAGKSTFATKLKEHYQIPVLYLDTVHFSANWIERSDEDMEKDMRIFIEKESWILEGNYRRIVPERFEIADQIFIFIPNRLSCLLGVIDRRIKYRKKDRVSRAKGCKEKLDFSFLMWVILTGRTKRRREFFKRIQKEQADKVITFKSKRQARAYLRDLKLKNV